MDKIKATEAGKFPPANASFNCLVSWLTRKGDFSKDIAPKELRGIHKYFNTFTDKGRFNTVLLTYAMVGVGGLYAWSKFKKTTSNSSIE